MNNYPCFKEKGTKNVRKLNRKYNIDQDIALRNVIYIYLCDTV